MTPQTHRKWDFADTHRNRADWRWTVFSALTLLLTGPAVLHARASVQVEPEAQSDTTYPLQDIPARRARPVHAAAGAPPAAAARSESPLLQLIDSESLPAPFTAEGVPRTPILAEDLNLNAVCCVGQEYWAVGDRGKVCVSQDGGKSWLTRFVPYDCSLHSVCFLSARHGWIAGTRFHPQHAAPRQAVLLQTRDGGLSWRDVADESRQQLRNADRHSRSQSQPLAQLPGLLKVQFFGLEEAIAVTLPGPTKKQETLFRSQDGGLTWQAIPSDQPDTHWTTGVFLSSTEGLVAGEQLAHATLVANQAVTIGRPATTLRGIQAVAASANGSAWMVGDGGFILKSHNAGVSWQTVDPGLDARQRQMLDLRAVAQRENTVLVAGAPASCMLRSADGGQTWQRIPVNQNGAIQHLSFTPDGRVLALASLGGILYSEDDGLSWTSAQSAGLRTGILNFVTDPTAASYELLAEQCADGGVRSVAIQLAADDAASHSGAARATALERLSQTQASLSAGSTLHQLAVNGIESDWMFPRNRAEHHLSAPQLIAEWNRQTDGELRELLPLRIARLIRMWKPSVIVIEPLSDDGQVATLTKSILPEALRLAAAASDSPVAAGSTRLSPTETSSTLGSLFLQPWNVERVVIRCSENRTSPLSFARDNTLETLGTTNGLITRFATAEFGLLAGQRLARADRVYYETVPVDASTTATSPAAAVSVTPAHLLEGISHHLGSDARRATTRLSRDELHNIERAARMSQTERAALAGHLQLSSLQNAFEAELQTIGSQLPPALALQQLLDLAALNEQSNNIDGWISVQQEIVRRFPESQAATQAALFLFSYYSSAEVRRYRMTQMQQGRNSQNAAPGVPGTPQARNSPLAGITTGSSDGSFPATSLPFDSTVSAPLPNLVVPASGFQVSPKIEPATGVRFGADSHDHGQTLMTAWDRQAARALQLLVQNFQQDLPTSVILRQAANLRQANRTGEHSTLLAEISARNDAWAAYAQTESQAVHGVSTPALPVFNLRKCLKRPWLDAALADECWVQAEEIRLAGIHAEASRPEPASFVMMAWDDQFLYVAGRFEFPADGPQAEPIAINRSHDAAHGIRDRFELTLDVDRDYATAFHFCVDQAGQTSERCELLTDWNPQWFAAAATDRQSWRIELAIPLDVLDLQQTRAGDLWTISLRRVLPGHLEHAVRTSFVQSEDGTSAAAASGNASATTDTALIRFIRSQRKP